MSGKEFDSLIIVDLGVFATLQGYELLCFGKKPDIFKVDRMARWKKAQKFFRWAGPTMIFGGFALWLFSRA